MRLRLEKFITTHVAKHTFCTTISHIQVSNDYLGRGMLNSQTLLGRNHVKLFWDIYIFLINCCFPIINKMLSL